MSSVTREEMIELLKVAACPAGCDNGVVVRDQLHGEIEQCQFCFEREKAIAYLQATEPVVEVRKMVEILKWIASRETAKGCYDGSDEVGAIKERVTSFLARHQRAHQRTNKVGEG